MNSVLTQEGDFELVVGDNANTDETIEILKAHLTDKRLRVVRSDRVISVTDNWMRTLRAATGDYFLMIGDDDLLLPDFFSRADALLRRHGDPEVLTFNAYSYVAPGSFGPDAAAMWSARHFNTRGLLPERELPLEERRAIVRDMFRFKVRFPLNMQLTFFSSAAAAAVPGDLFRAPFPDHFALNSLLLRARRLVVADERLLVVGVSPKSFGHYFYGGQQRSGVDYLGAGSAFPGMIEGSELVNSMHAWLLELRRTYPELRDVHVDRWAYLIRQANYWLRQYEFGVITTRTLIHRTRSLQLTELATVFVPMVVYRAARIVRDRARGRRRTYISDSWSALEETNAPSIREFAEHLPA
jgi:hypothetical protein